MVVFGLWWFNVVVVGFVSTLCFAVVLLFRLRALFGRFVIGGLCVTWLVVGFAVLRVVWCGWGFFVRDCVCYLLLCVLLVV